MYGVGGKINRIQGSGGDEARKAIDMAGTCFVLAFFVVKRWRIHYNYAKEIFD